MGARQSAETLQAIRLYQGGDSVYEAAKKAGIYPTTLYRALKNKKKKKLAKRIA